MTFKMAKGLLFSLLIFLSVNFISARILYLYYDSAEEKIIPSSTIRKEFGNWIAMSVTEDVQNQTGFCVLDHDVFRWGYLEVYTSESVEDIWQAYGAGIVESYTQKLSKMNMIATHIHNTIGDMCQFNLSSFCIKLKSYLETNLKFLYQQIQSNDKADPYWYQVKLFLIQLRGLIDGYEGELLKPDYRIENVLHPLMLMQIGGDMDDLQSALTGESTLKGPIGSGSCSALIKLLEDCSDLYVSQDTWNGYESMLRYLKKYDFKFHKSEGTGPIPGQIMTFSSYPGILTSGDDFYTISSGLATLETTIGNGNASLWKYVRPEGAVLEPVRSMVANRLATSGDEWCKMFSKYNSGTYNNQWMVVDYKLFKKGEVPSNGTLFVLEQIPGTIEYRDNTDILVKQKYWPSYNVPSFKEIFNASGEQEMVEKFGDWFTYEHTARANIFRRDHSKVKDLDSMLKLMRYNDFTHDPLSACNCTPPFSAENAISARSDLNPINGTYPFGALGHRAHGGTDSKITSSKLFSTFQFVSVSSPSYYDVPPFQWSKSDFKDKLSHVGHPDLWTFKPFVHKWKNVR